MSRYVESPRILDEPHEAESMRQIATRALEINVVPLIIKPVFIVSVFIDTHSPIVAQHHIYVNQNAWYARLPT